jgi:biotin carboxyl carrier protein
MKKIDLIINGNKYNVEIGNIDGNRIEVNVNGTYYDVELSKNIEIPKTPTIVSTVVNKAVKETIPEPVDSVSTRQIKSPLPGVVLTILVKEGDTVQRGQTLVIIEAMKMENEIKADGPGIVKRILIHKGDTISEGQTLVEIGG